MRSLLFCLVIMAATSSCDLFFKIEDTTHKLIVKNDSDISFDLQWSVNGEDDAKTLLTSDRGSSSGSVRFLFQDGHHEQLTADEIYDLFDELVLVVENRDGTSQEIELRALQIEPSIQSDGFMMGEEHYYTFTVINEHLN
ncbi:MAG: hypothetical protein R8G66_26230 [Cytophagales bacterium]|nr:hypothetical protein [Cytophagales bacterium]